MVKGRSDAQERGERISEGFQPREVHLLSLSVSCDSSLQRLCSSPFFSSLSVLSYPPLLPVKIRVNYSVHTQSEGDSCDIPLIAFEELLFREA